MAEEKQRKLRPYGLKVVPINDDSLWREATKIKGKCTLSLADAFTAATAIVPKSKLVVDSDKDLREPNIQLLKIRD